MTMSKSIENSVTYLSSPQAVEAIRQDPYWPKWDGPWWHMLTLFEMGLAHRIPKESVVALIRSIEERYPKFFPFKESDLPPGSNPYRDSPCHCQLGCVYQVLHACGVNVDAELPWIRGWFLKSQLPDGGLNCDNDAYLKSVPKSSITSSLPPLEAILFCTARVFTEKEEHFLNSGAEYLLSHQLCRRRTTGEIIETSWLLPCFPHFYEYSVLRGIRFLKAWGERFGKVLPDFVSQLEAEQSQSYFKNGRWLLKRKISDSSQTTVIPTFLHQHEKGPAKTFLLLDAISGENGSEYLTSWLNQDRKTYS